MISIHTYVDKIILEVMDDYPKSDDTHSQGKGNPFPKFVSVSKNACGSGTS